MVYIYNIRVNTSLIMYNQKIRIAPCHFQIIYLVNEDDAILHSDKKMDGDKYVISQIKKQQINSKSQNVLLSSFFSNLKRLRVHPL